MNDNNSWDTMTADQFSASVWDLIEAARDSGITIDQLLGALEKNATVLQDELP